MSSKQWYSGSDESGKVPSVVEEVSVLLEEDPPDVGPAHLETLKGAIEVEDEPNWIAFLTGLAGMVLEALDLSDEARKAYVAAADISRPDLETFDDTLNVYCQANYNLGRMLMEEDRYEEALETLLRVVPYMALVFQDEYRGTIATFVSHCLTELGSPRFALPFAEAAAYFRPDDKGVLEFLQKAYVATGLEWKADGISRQNETD